MLKVRSLQKFGSGVFLTLWLGGSASAYAPYLNNFIEHYQTNTIDVSNLVAERSCGLCHVSTGGGGRRNGYGNDFKKVTLGDRAGFNGIEFLDSDSDSFNNLEEIFLQTQPGASESVAESRLVLGFDPANSLLEITSGVECDRLVVISFGSRVAEQGKAFATFQEGAQGRLEIEEVIFPTTLKVEIANGVILAKCGNSVGSILFE